LLGVLFVISTFGFAITLSPLAAAFHFKRFLFKRNNPGDIGLAGILYPRYRANATELYNSGIYRLEDQLFNY
jgi:hypothetical protein